MKQLNHLNISLKFNNNFGGLNRPVVHSTRKGLKPRLMGLKEATLGC